MKRNLQIIKKRKNLWKIFNWGFISDSYLYKNHSLNCGCGMCRMKTYYNRLENKQERLNSKNNIKNILKNNEK